MKIKVIKALLLCGVFSLPSFTLAVNDYTFKAGHKSLKGWLLGDVPYPDDNKPNTARIELGKKYFSTLV